MTSIPMNLAIEDELSEKVLLRLLTSAGRYLIGSVYGRSGFGYLKKTIRGWNNAAKSMPFLILTDLDMANCPAELISDWLPVPKHPNLLLRVAVREVESWILADAENIAGLLGVSPNLLPTAPDLVMDPKRELVNLARQSRLKSIRDSIAPRAGSTAKQGPDYNHILGSFVRDTWDIQAASLRSPSLDRTVGILRSFQPHWPQQE